MSRPDGGARGGAAGLALVVVIALVAGGVSYVGERVVCSVAPELPILGATCATDPVALAVIIGACVGVVSLLAWWASRRRGG